MAIWCCVTFFFFAKLLWMYNKVVYEFLTRHQIFSQACCPWHSFIFSLMLILKINVFLAKALCIWEPVWFSPCSPQDKKKNPTYEVRKDQFQWLYSGFCLLKTSTAWVAVGLMFPQHDIISKSVYFHSRHSDKWNVMKNGISGQISLLWFAEYLSKTSM